MNIRLTKYSLFVLLALSYIGSSLAAENRQCIQAPSRTSPCPNLLYTTVILDEKAQTICVCKSDKQPLLQLISDTDNAQSRVNLRKLLSQHNLSGEQLFQISQTLSN